MNSHGKTERYLALGLIAILLLTAMTFAPGVQAQVLATPTGTVTKVAAENCGTEYTVRKGDSLGLIALRCGVTVANLLSSNPSITDRSLIITGQKLAIPQGTGGIPVTGGGIWSGLTGNMAAPRHGGLPFATATQTGGTTGGATKVVPVTGGTYTVVSGDTLESIATKFGVTLDQLLLANPNLIKVGQAINLPAGAVMPTQSPTEETKEPTQGPAEETKEPTQAGTQSVPVTGATVTATHTPTAMATQAVPVTGATATKEPTLAATATKVPTQVATATKAPTGTQAVPVTGNTYTVQTGDTFESIASRLGVTVKALVDANPNLIKAGDVLNLPAGAKQPTQAATATKAATSAPVTGATATKAPTGTQGVPVTGGSYTVQSGDTLESLAAKFGVTVNELLAANPELIKPGTVLNLPAGAKVPTGQATQGATATKEATLAATATKAPTQAATATKAATGTQAVPVTGGTYTVKQGDTLESIATQMGITVNELLQLNPNIVLQPNQTLKLPSGAASPTQGVTATKLATQAATMVKTPTP